MTVNSADWEQLLTILVMAIALGMDAFSIGIGIGMKGIRLLDILKIGLLIAIFHTIMPLIGMYTGHYVSSLLGNVATALGGGLLTILGIHMIYSSFRNEEVRSIEHLTFWGMLAFALTVSIDSFSLGITLGIFSSSLLLTIFLFGAFGGLMSLLGLWLGRRAGYWIGTYGEAAGGVILLVFGLNFLRILNF